MAERVVWDHEAAGSRPVTRTTSGSPDAIRARTLSFYAVLCLRRSRSVMNTHTARVPLSNMRTRLFCFIQRKKPVCKLCRQALALDFGEQFFGIFRRLDFVISADDNTIFIDQICGAYHTHERFSIKFFPFPHVIKGNDFDFRIG